MWWRWVLRAAVAVGLDDWAKKKAGQLITKIKDKAVNEVTKTREAGGGGTEAEEKAKVSD